MTDGSETPPQQSEAPTRRFGNFAALRNTSLALAAVCFANFGLSGITTTEQSSSGDSNVLRLDSEYDFSLYEYSEIALGYSRDKVGPFNSIETWTNVEGIARKKLMFVPPYPVITEMREDALGKYMYVYMKDDDGKEVSFNYKNMTIEPLSLQPCYEEGVLNFPTCPDPNSPDFQGAVDTPTSDRALVWDSPDMLSNARRASDVTIFGRYCIGKMFGTNDPDDPELLTTTLPNTHLAYRNFRNMVEATIKVQGADGTGLPLYDKHGLPTYRFDYQEAAIEEAIKVHGIELFEDAEKAETVMWGYSNFDNTRHVMETGSELELNIGKSYGQKIIDLEKKYEKVDMSGTKEDEDEPVILGDDPDHSSLNWQSCAVGTFANAKASTGPSLSAIIKQNTSITNLYGTAGLKADGTIMPEAEIDRIYASLDTTQGNGL